MAWGISKYYYTATCDHLFFEAIFKALFGKKTINKFFGVKRERKDANSKD